MAPPGELGPGAPEHPGSCLDGDHPCFSPDPNGPDLPSADGNVSRKHSPTQSQGCLVGVLTHYKASDERKCLFF